MKNLVSITREDFDRLLPKIVGFLLSRGMSKEDARDLAQTVFLEAFKGLETFQHRSQLDTWVLGISKKLYLQDLRSRGRLKREAHLVSFDELGTVERSIQTSSGERYLFHRSLLRRAQEAIARLPQEQRSALVMKVRGASYEEIAESLEIPQRKIGGLIYQARESLRSQLGDGSSKAVH